VVRNHNGLLVCAVLTFGLLGGLLLWYMPYRRKIALRSNEQAADVAISDLREIERVFKEQDKDGNGVNDFWTGDVSGLHTFGLLDRAVAEADVAPLSPLVSKPVPYHGYYFMALEGDDGHVNTDFSNKMDTGGNVQMGKVHHLNRYSFCAFPEIQGVTGRRIYIVNENRTVFFSEKVQPPKSWPNDVTLMMYWSKE
jgi:hypothetical protein